jgi:RNA polymerase sigma factor for flagellar operon FliA
MDSIKCGSSPQATSTQQLVIQHLTLAATIACNISKRLPRHLDLRDIHQDARLGLVKAAAAYDVRKNVPFGAYARRRIHGAVVDGLRRDDHLTRSARARARADGGEALEHPLSLVDPDRIAGVLLEPDQFAVGSERERLLAGAIETLPGRIQVLLHAYYYSGKTMREIGYGLGVTQGRVSQLHARAIKLLRAHFEQSGFTSSAQFTIQQRVPEARS